MFTSAEARELRDYCARYPIDDESNTWLPHGFLMAKLSNMMGGNDPKSAKDFMPFAKMAEEAEPVQAVPNLTKKHAKRVKRHMKNLAKSRSW